MKTISVRRFDGMAQDYLNGQVGEFSLAKGFDTISYPWRLQPVRGMSAESTTNSKIGNILLAAGRIYGVGTDPNNPTNGKLWVRSDNNTTASGSSFGASATWRSLTNDQLSGAVLRTADYNFLVEYPDAESPDTSNTRTIFWASTNLLIASSPTGTIGTTTQALTFATISQGFVHPKDKKLYFGYQTTGVEGSLTYIGIISNNTTPFGSFNATALQLPGQFRVYSVCDYGNYLAILCTAPNSTSANSSVVFLWDRDTSLATVTETIPWGNGLSKVLNNLDGQLVGVSTVSNGATGILQDYDAFQVRVYGGGTAPTVVKEISALHGVASGTPSCLIHENVNFVQRNRLYFSADVIPGDGTTARYGLWSFGKSRTGRWCLTLERSATNDNSDTGVIASAIAGDFVSMAHTAVGTLTATSNGQTSASTYGGTYDYQSPVNPDMDELDAAREKKLYCFYANYYPLLTGQSVVLEYKVDALPSTAWTSVATDSTVGSSNIAMPKASSAEFTDGQAYEFRVKPLGGATVTDWGYRFEAKKNSLY